MMNALDKELYEYEEKYGKIPNDQNGRVQYLLGKKANNEKYFKDIMLSVQKIKRIKSTTVKFTMYKVLKPSARPRLTTRAGFARMYVPHAAANGDWFQKFMEENQLPRVETPCSIVIDVYEKTPSDLNKKETILAEMGYIRPWRRSGDVDNYAKSVLDMIQHGMLADDYLVVDCEQHLHYSCKPHTDVKITFMNKFPEI